MAIVLKNILTGFWRLPLINSIFRGPKGDRADRAGQGQSPEEASHNTPCQIPRCRSLDGFTEMSSSLEGIAVQKLAAFDTIYVHTANGDYRLFLLDPEERHVMVEDGRLFVEPVEMSLSGSTFGGSMLKMGWIGVGLQMEFYAHGNRITSPVVLSVRVDRELTIDFAA